MAGGMNAKSSKAVIGLGTWMDKVAYRLVEREKNLGRSLNLLRTQAGIGASGNIHIGSVSDSVRAYAISLAVRNLGYDSEMIQFADDMDGLRSIPSDMPSSLSKYLLHPVSLVPDPFGCHESFAIHVESLLIDALEMMGIEAKLYRGYEVYSRGLFRDQIAKILSRWREVGEKIEELTGQSKFKEVLPYFPLCSSCGRIYTSVAKEFDPSRGIVPYKCVGVSIKGVRHAGCGNEDEADISKAEGKLSWKVEWAARWAGLDIRFEAFGKDLAASVKVNDWVSKNILGFEPPMHLQYELFLDESRRKISKSKAGSVFTPHSWFRYGTPQSLVLLLLKRIRGARVVSPRLIPSLMNEVDRLAENYFSDGGDMARKGLYQYVYLMNPPQKKPSSVPYNLLLALASTAPKDREMDFIASRLRKYGYIVDGDVQARIGMAVNYYRDYGQPERGKVELSGPILDAVKTLAEKLTGIDDGEKLQGLIFSIAREHGLQPSEFFKTLYMIFLGQDRGPRLGPFIIEDLGKAQALEVLRAAISANV